MKHLMATMIDSIKEIPFWRFIVLFVCLGILISEILIATQNYIIYGEIIDEQLIMGFFSSAIISFIVVYYFAILLKKYKHQSSALQQSEQLFYLLSEKSSDIIYRLSLSDKIFEYLSPSVLSVLGYEPDECYENPHLLTQVVQDEWQSLLSDIWKQHLKAQRISNIEFQAVHKDGSRRWLSLRNLIVNDQFGKPHKAVGVISDITDRKCLQNELGESEQRFQDLFDLSPDPAWIVENHRFVESNQAAITLMGFANKEELFNVHPSKVSPEQQPDGENSFGKAERMMKLAEKKGIHRFEWVHFRKDGSEFLAEVTLSTIMWQNKPVIYGSLRDISERRITEQRLRNGVRHLFIGMPSKPA